MNESDYIMLVKSTVDEPDGILKIAAIELPIDTSPLLALIRGDAQQLQHDLDYANNHDPTDPDEDEIRELAREVSMQIISKIKRYLSDWDSGNTYQYGFKIKATYGAFKNEHGDIEYIDVIQRDPGVKTVSGAVKAARTWQSHLLERIKLYPNQETGHKLISVDPTYIIRDSYGIKIAAGTMRFKDGRDISTWLNQR